jgi:hypothetical protein
VGKNGGSKEVWVDPRNDSAKISRGIFKGDRTHAAGKN